jgi:hypothetical protein
MQDGMDEFAYLGAFNARFGYPAVPDGHDGPVGNPRQIGRQLQGICFRKGAVENNAGARMFRDQVDETGIFHVYFVASGNCRTWQTGRKGPIGETPLLSQN